MQNLKMEQIKNLRLFGVLDSFEPYISESYIDRPIIFFIGNNNTLNELKIPDSVSGSMNCYLIYIETDNAYELDKRKDELEELCANTYMGHNLYEERISEISQKNITKIVLYTLASFVALISVFNIFNTIVQSIILRKREIAELKSLGMNNKQLSKMLFLEGIFYGLDSIIYGTGISAVTLYIIYYLMMDRKLYAFYFPWKYIVISACITYLVIFIAMHRAKRKIKHKEIIDEIRNENI